METKIQDTKIPIKTNPDLEMENIQQPKEINQEEPIQPQPQENQEEQPQEEQLPEEEKEELQENQQEQPQETQQEIQEESPETQDILTQIAEKEKAIRSKILNRQCRKKPIITTTDQRTKEKSIKKTNKKKRLLNLFRETRIKYFLRNLTRAIYLNFIGLILKIID